MFPKFFKVYIWLFLILAFSGSFTSAKVVEIEGQALKHVYEKPLSKEANNNLAKFFLLRGDIWAKLTMKQFIRTHKPQPLTPSDDFATKYDLVQRVAFEDEMITVSKKQRTNNRHVVFLHGGFYLFAQRGLERTEEDIEIMLKHLGDRVTYVDYPSSKTANYQTINATAKDAYLKLVAAYPNDEFILVGNSAGANMALSLGQQLKKEGIPTRPKKYILISPWVDMTVGTDQSLANYDFYDIILSRPSLKYGADLFRDGLEYKNPKISSLYGDFNDLGDIAIFIGTFDLNYESSVKLYEKAKAQGLKVHHYQYNRMWHDWMMYLTVPEAIKAWEKAAEFVR